MNTLDTYRALVQPPGTTGRKIIDATYRLYASLTRSWPSWIELLTTNQKDAGSSPAERAPESPANAAFLPLGINSKAGLCHPFDHLSLSKRLRRASLRATQTSQFWPGPNVSRERYLALHGYGRRHTIPNPLFLNRRLPAHKKRLGRSSDCSLVPAMCDVPGSWTSRTASRSTRSGR
jgi:hypothetical protein